MVKGKIMVENFFDPLPDWRQTCSLIAESIKKKQKVSYRSCEIVYGTCQKKVLSSWLSFLLSLLGSLIYLELNESEIINDKLYI